MGLGSPKFVGLKFELLPSIYSYSLKTAAISYFTRFIVRIPLCPFEVNLWTGNRSVSRINPSARLGPGSLAACRVTNDTAVDPRVAIEGAGLTRWRKSSSANVHHAAGSICAHVLAVPDKLTRTTFRVHASSRPSRGAKAQNPLPSAWHGAWAS